MQQRRLYRSNSDKMIAGICGGLAEYMDGDPTLIRLIMVFLCLITGVLPLFIVYLVGWIIIPLK
jgi:phage shock protein C